MAKLFLSCCCVWSNQQSYVNKYMQSIGFDMFDYFLFFVSPAGNCDLRYNSFVCEGQRMSKSLLIEDSGSCKEGMTGIASA